MYLDVWGRISGCRREYNVLPLGEFLDYISAYKIIEGNAEEETSEMFIPSLK